MKNIKENRWKSVIRNAQDHTGYELGRNLRRNINRQISQLGKTLNTEQHRLGTRATGVILVLGWTIAFLYFLNLLLTIFEKL